MKALKYILFLLLIGIIGTAIYIAVQPNEFDFSRSKIIKAPKAMIFNKVNDFKNWPDFSPWIEKDLNANLLYGKKTSGVDGNYAWNGKILGEGSMKTIAIETNKKISQNIEFIKPFESQSNINWFFENTETGTKVTWNMKGKQDFITKMYTTFAGSIEENTAPDFERGLFKLDSILNADMKKYTVTIDGITEYGGGFYMYKTTSATGANINQVMSQQYGEIMSFMASQSIKQQGMPFTIYHNIDTAESGIVMSQAIPVQNKITITGDSKVLCGYMPKTKVLKTTLKGNYTYLPKAWEATHKYVAENNMQLSELFPFEIYQTDPDNVPNPADWITEIYIPIKE